jgi:hypothetical protein
MLRPRHVLTLALALSGSTLACKSDEAHDEQPKLMTLDISAVDPALPGKLLIDVPPGSKTQQFRPGAITVRGPQAGLFSITIDVEPRDLERDRSEPDDVVLDEPNLVITKLEIGDAGTFLMFGANVTVGERTFACFQDTGAKLDREQLEPMIAACRSLRIE